MKKIIRLTESDLHKIVKESVEQVLKEDYKENLSFLSKDDLNFFPNDDFSKQPTHRVNIFYKNGGDVSSPAIFSSDEEAIRAAMKKVQKAQSVGEVGCVEVEKYNDVDNGNGFRKLEKIFRKEF